MRLLSKILHDEGLFARAMRSSAWTMLGYGTSQAIRLGSNLILTRLLFPEAFGMMALVTVFMIGLAHFSDVGIAPSIMQNKRGDDPDFLDTAWTIQVIRGAGLWLCTCALAWPVALFYGEPMLAELLPVAGLSLFVTGFNPTRLDTAHRHLLLGRVTIIDLASQTVGIIAMILLAWAMQSVWALVVGGVVTPAAKLAITWFCFPGRGNSFRWDRSAAKELVRFGKWIFLSTACSFMINQGDRMILGKYLSLQLLGIYNIGYFLASFPIYLAGTVVWRILIPLYRERPPAESRENFVKIRKMRFALTGFILSMLLALAFIGVPLIDLLYDPRYETSGAILVLVACVQIPQVIGMSYDQAILAAGDSRRYFVLVAVKATLQTVFFIIGAESAGLIGALTGQGLAYLLIYPLIIWMARLHGAWDALHDGVFGFVGLALGALALWHSRDAVQALLAFSQ